MDDELIVRLATQYWWDETRPWSMRTKYIVLDDPIYHFSTVPFYAACGADKPGQYTTQIRENVTCEWCKRHASYLAVGNTINTPVSDKTTNLTKPITAEDLIRRGEKDLKEWKEADQKLIDGLREQGLLRKPIPNTMSFEEEKGNPLVPIPGTEKFHNATTLPASEWREMPEEVIVPKEIADAIEEFGFGHTVTDPHTAEELLVGWKAREEKMREETRSRTSPPVGAGREINLFGSWWEMKEGVTCRNCRQMVDFNAGAMKRHTRECLTAEKK